MENRTIWIKKLIYRSKYTGTKETDLLLGNFAENYLTKLNDDQLLNYEKLLVTGDPRIWRLSIDVEKTDNEKEKNIILLIKEFKGF
ncbi:MAG: succinate dehydrogenase assembly factor 2 [Proteobacteria bacterium]|nr:succinate dehydrogenase assembly factor 2 [Pseudomonadota bacterium]